MANSNIPGIIQDTLNAIATANLRKDVFDLLTAKVSLLKGQIDDLTSENSVLKGKVSRLEIENSQLRTQLQDPAPKLKLHVESLKILAHLFSHDGETISVTALASLIGRQKGETKFFCDKLANLEFIRWNMTAMMERWDENDDDGYEITAKGREYYMQSRPDSQS